MFLFLFKVTELIQDCLVYKILRVSVMTLHFGSQTSAWVPLFVQYWTLHCDLQLVADIPSATASLALM